MTTLAVFGPLDWSIVAAYFALVILVSFAVARKKQDPGEYFLGGRSLPTWAVAVSLVATMLSTATFVGVPDETFNGDISYLILNLGGFLAVFLVGFFFIPRLYRAGTVTIYGFLAQRFGEPARLAVSCAFILGRFLASGARLFLAALPLCLLMFGAKVPSFHQVALAIVLIALVGTFYATIGGVRAVVWVDTLQFAIVIGTALLSVGILLHHIPLSLPEIFQTLAHPPLASSKLHLLDTSLNPAKPFTLCTALLTTFFMTAAFGVDHDLAQRFLIAKSPARGALSVIASQFISIVVVSLFLFIGLLLCIFYQRPDIMHTLHPATADLKKIYPWFLLNELPSGLAGLAIAGFFAIAQGSLDSAINALASSIVADVYLPLKTHFAEARLSRSHLATSSPCHPVTPSASSKASKFTVAAVGLVMALFAILCAALFDPEHSTLLNYVLGVMTFAYTGMLGVFLTALFTRRGNSASVLAALLIGILTVVLLQDRIIDLWLPPLLGYSQHFAWPWWMALGSTLAFLTCLLGSPKPASQNPPLS